jgi:ABC transporter substrate binding protein
VTSSSTSTRTPSTSSISFHLAMRLTVLQQMAKGLPQTISDEEESYRLRDPVVRSLERLRWLLWHGNVDRALQIVEAVEMDLDVAVATGGGTARNLPKAMQEFHTYIECNRGCIPNDGERYRDGQRNSTGVVASMVNQVISKRFCKRQQLQWTKRRAHPCTQEASMTCRTIGLLAVLVLGMLVGLRATAAQTAAKVPRIGFLSTGGIPNPSCSQPDFLRGLHEHGYVDGQTISIIWRCAEGRTDRAHQFADELAQLGVDVIVSVGLAGSLAVKAATRTIPIIFVGIGDAVVAGVVPSLAQPGGNVTGVTNIPDHAFLGRWSGD